MSRRGGYNKFRGGNRQLQGGRFSDGKSKI